MKSSAPDVGAVLARTVAPTRVLYCLLTLDRDCGLTLLDLS